MSVLPRPCSPTEAVARARRLLADPTNRVNGYVYGAGDYRPRVIGGVLIDLPWTPNSDGKVGADCRTAFSWCYKVQASRPGYNRGEWATVADDVNYNSLIEDSEHAQDLVVPVTAAPQIGDLCAYPTIYLPGHPLPWIGHGAIVIGVSRVVDWDPDAPAFHELDIMQVCGPPNRSPAAIPTDGFVFDHHTIEWPLPEHRSRLLRAQP